MAIYSLKTVVRQTHLTPETVRAWERRYAAVSPKRSPKGRRLYSDSDIHRLRLLSTLVSRGFRIGEIAKLDEKALTQRLEATREEAQSHTTQLQTRGVSELVDALEKFNLEGVRRALVSVQFSMSPREFAFELVPHLMFCVGSLISKGALSIAQEHALSQMVRAELVKIYDSIAFLELSAGSPPRISGEAANRESDRRAKTVVFATRENDLHDLALLMSAILCRTRGLHCLYLGPNLPLDSLLGAIQSTRPHSVVLSLAELPKDEEVIEPQDLLDQLNEKMPKHVEIWMGGLATRGIRRPRSGRTILEFESIESLERKLEQVYR